MCSIVSLNIQTEFGVGNQPFFYRVSTTPLYINDINMPQFLF